MAELRDTSVAVPAARRATAGPDDALAPVRAWIANNETLAVVAGFAMGVFIGALMRR